MISVKCLNLIGLSLNIIGTLLIAVSFAAHPSANVTVKGKTRLLAIYMGAPRFWTGIALVVIGFALQFLATLSAT